MDDGRGCYLTFTEENNGTLYVNWSEKPVDGVSSSSLHCMGPHLAPLPSRALYDLQCACVCMYTVCYMGFVRSVRHSCQSAVTDVLILSPHTHLICHACSPPQTTRHFCTSGRSKQFRHSSSSKTADEVSVHACRRVLHAPMKLVTSNSLPAFAKAVLHTLPCPIWCMHKTHTHCRNPIWCVHKTTHAHCNGCIAASTPSACECVVSHAPPQ